MLDNQRRVAISLVMCGALGALLIGSQSLPPQQTGVASLIFHNGTVYTVDPLRPRAQAIAISGDRILAVGDTAEILKLKGPASKLVDLQGRSIVPGLHDAHGHFTGLGASLQRLNFRGTTSYQQIIEMVGQRAAQSAPGEWILGRAWDQNDWPEKKFPTHDLLSKVSPNNPVYLTRVDGHAGLANKRAMALAGLTAATKDPSGGEIIRDAQGNPTGVLIDRAQRFVTSKIPSESTARREEQIKLADEECRRLGLTMVHDAGTDATTVDLYKKLVEAGSLETRLYVMRRGQLSDLTPHFEKGPLMNLGNHHLTVRAIKITADGALGSYGAALLESYSDRPETTGLLTTPPEEIYAQASSAAKAGFQVCVHAIGDRANRNVIDILERVMREVPGSAGLRHRIEHAQILDAQDIPRFAKLGIIASMQATHATSDMPWVPTRIGEARAREGAYVWQKLLRSGARVANGSDFPVEEANPLLGIYAAITRQDPQGHPPDGWYSDQRMSRQEALRSFTLDAAYAAHAENDLGSLRPGKLADLLVLSKDIMTIEAREILTTEVMMTVIGGRVVYERPKS